MNVRGVKRRQKILIHVSLVTKFLSGYQICKECSTPNVTPIEL
jgi:hypothetical protein